MLDLLQRSCDLLAKIDNIEWLNDKIEGAEVQSHGSELLRVYSSQHDDFTGGLDLFDTAQYFDAVGFRHQDIEQDNIGFGITHYRDCPDHRIRFHQTKIFAENHLERFAHPQFIVNNQ